MTILLQDNFDSDTVGALPAGWAAVVGGWRVSTNSPVSGANTLFNYTVASNNLAVYTGAPAAAAMGVQVDQMVASSTNPITTTSGVPLYGLWLRGDALGNGYIVLAFNAAPASGASGQIGIGFYRNTVAVGLVAIGAIQYINVTPGDVLHLRGTIVGQVMKAYAWANSNAQPSTPTNTFTDSSGSALTAPGYAGLWFYRGLANSTLSNASGADNFLVDNVGGVNAPGAPTTLTSTGPATGVTTQPSVYQLYADGTFATGVTITPSDNGAGGAFSPTTAVMGPAASPISFIYTPANAGTASITFSNSGGLTNPAPISTTVTAVQNATAVVMTGPSQLAVGVAATYTATIPNLVSGTVVVTLTDGGAGGTFTPTTLSLSGYGPSGTVSYKPAGIATSVPVSCTNNGSLANTAAAAAALYQNVAPTNVAIYQSPYNWDNVPSGTLQATAALLQTALCGAYLRTIITGTTTVGVVLDPSRYMSGTTVVVPSGSLLITARLDNGKAEVTLPVQQASALYQFFTGLTTAAHTVEFYLSGSTETVGSRWGTAGVSSTCSIRVAGIMVDQGATLSAPTVKPKTALFFGDSITEGVRALGTTTEPVDHGKSYPWFLAPALNAERSVIGFGSQGWVHGGNGAVPVFPSAWNLQQIGRNRTFTPAPDYVFVMQGQNDGNSTSIIAPLVAWLASARAAFPNAWIFIVPPPSGLAATNLAAAVAQYRASNPGDAKVQYLNYLPNFANGGISGSLGSSTAQSADGIHPIELENARIANAIAALAMPFIGKTRYFGVGGTWY